MSYLVWDSKVIQDFSDENITSMYENGYVFTRKSRGTMNKTRSLRINLSLFSFHTKNKRVLRKTDDMQLSEINLPISADEYDWHIHKLGKDYYDKKFGSNIFSASKIKELVTDRTKSNFNLLYRFGSGDTEIVGYAIAFQNSTITHYAYPFYDLDKYFNHYGMGMMLRAISSAKDKGCKYFYLGSVSKPKDIYKLYFRGLEWNDGKQWRTDIDFLKELIFN